MYSKSKALTSIPESNESEADAATKWVPKKKHEVLKAKYKCLKKLFQIYDASVIGILPETGGQGDGCSAEGREPDSRRSRRKKRSHRTRTDACAGTDLTSETSEPVGVDAATTVMRDLKIDCSETMTAQSEVTKSISTVACGYKQDSALSKECLSEVNGCGCARGSSVPFSPVPYSGEGKRPTRFQLFIQRLLGLRREPFEGNALGGRALAASDDDISQRYVEKRRRRGLRCRRLRRAKKVHSEGALRGAPLLACAQAVQRNCLLDTTPRHCPIAGCRMMFYGIINYNDHLNLCHFRERRFVCHFCHEGFQTEMEKLQHEGEHVGLSRLTALAAPRSRAVTSVTQTEPGAHDEKLRKIVSLFDKIGDEQMLAEIRQNSRRSESNLEPTVASDSGQSCASGGVKRMSSCVETSARSRAAAAGVACDVCGEKFDYRRQLSLHVDLEHRMHDKYSKFHSCAGIVGPSAPGQLTVTTAASSLAATSVTRTDSEASGFSRPSIDSIVGRLKTGMLKWEPGTRIIRV